MPAYVQAEGLSPQEGASREKPAQTLPMRAQRQAHTLARVAETQTSDGAAY
jgi:hypothetical protein